MSNIYSFDYRSPLMDLELHQFLFDEFRDEMNFLWQTIWYYEETDGTTTYKVAGFDTLDQAIMYVAEYFHHSWGGNPILLGVYNNLTPYSFTLSTSFSNARVSD